MSRKLVSFICALSLSTEILRASGMLLLATVVGAIVFVVVDRGLALVEKELLEELCWLRRPSDKCLRRLGLLLKMLRGYSFERALLASAQHGEEALKTRLRSGEAVENLLEEMDAEERALLANILEFSRRSTRKSAAYAEELYKTLSRLDRAAQRFEEWRKILAMRVKLLIVAFSTTLGFLSALIPAILRASNLAHNAPDCLSLLLTFYAIASVSTYVISSITGGTSRNLMLSTICYIPSAAIAWNLAAPLSF